MVMVLFIKFNLTLDSVLKHVNCKIVLCFVDIINNVIDANTTEWQQVAIYELF